MTPPLPPLVRYALQHMRVTTNVCTHQKSEDGYTLKSRTVPDYNFIHVTRGRVVWAIAGQPFPLGPLDLVWVPPETEHHAYSLTAHITLGSVHVEAALPGGQDVFGLLLPPRLLRVPAGSLLDAYLRGAAEECRRPSFEARLMLPSWAEMITREFFRLHAVQGRLRYREADPFVAAMLEHLDTCLNRPVTLAELSRRAGFSSQHLNRLFRRVLGVTPLQYLMRARMERAAGLLREGTLTVNAVAQKVGFEDPYYFSRMFRQHQGRSPAHYRAESCSDSPSTSSGRPFTS